MKHYLQEMLYNSNIGYNLQNVVFSRAITIIDLIGPYFYDDKFCDNINSSRQDEKLELCKVFGKFFYRQLCLERNYLEGERGKEFFAG